jgi:hypothetical protein
MTTEDALKVLRFFFPRSFSPETQVLKSEDGQRIIERLMKLETDPINLTHFNQLLHLNHEAGVTEGFFRYYFLTHPLQHPYPVDKLSDPIDKKPSLMPGLDERAIWSLNQLKWGLTRLFVDGLLYWGDVRSAFRELRTKTLDELTRFFSEKRVNSEYMRSRGPYLPLHTIEDTDRYLISEILCKALEKPPGSNEIPLLEWLRKAFKDRANKAISVGSLLNSVWSEDETRKGLLIVNLDKLKETVVDGKEAIAGLVKNLSQQFEGIESLLQGAYRKRATGKVLVANLLNSVVADNPTTRAAIDICAEEIRNECVGSEDEIEQLIRPLIDRFIAARKVAAENTRLYLSMVNEMDVYVATSMRTRQNFEDVAKTCRSIFEREGLHRFCVRYFDPTMSIANSPEDKGLIECLMVKCSKVSLYLAGEADSYGKDAEIAMTLSLGKPVVILCPDTPRGRLRESIFRDVHPLSRLIDFQTGVAVGVMVTKDENIAAQVIERVFDNKMEYDLESMEGYYRLKERLTESIIRLQTNTRLLRESFWNYYHGIQ